MFYNIYTIRGIFQKSYNIYNVGILVLHSIYCHICFIVYIQNMFFGKKTYNIYTTWILFVQYIYRVYVRLRYIYCFL